MTLADGTVVTFPGVPDGTPGHHVATVTVPVAGHFALATDQGWFADQELGHLDVGGGAASDAGGERWPTALLVATAAVTGLALVLLAVQATVLVRDRRRSAGLAQA